PALVEAAPADACGEHECGQKIQQFLTTCVQSCAIVGAARGVRDPRLKAACRANCVLGARALEWQCKHNGGCFGSEQTCCSQQCVDTDSDSTNCGACGHACPEGHACVDGQCQC